MKILNSYSQMAKSLYIEADVDDDKIIKYKDKDGESAEMKASSARTMEKDHPAKIAWDDMRGDDSEEKDSDGAIGGDDFDRDSNKAGEDDYETGPGQGIDWKHPDDPEDDEEPSGEESKVEVPEDESEWAIEMKDAGPMAQEYDEVERDYKDSQNPKYADDFTDEEKAELEKRWEDAQNKYNAYVKKGVEKGWLDKDGYRRGVKVAFAGIPDEKDEPSDEEIIQHIEDEGYRDDFDRDGNPTPEAYEDAKEKLIAQNKEKDESITINGQKYRPIKESKQHILKENYERFFGKNSLNEYTISDSDNLWDSNGVEDRQVILKALKKDRQIMKKIGPKPYWDDIDLVADNDEGDTVATLRRNMTFKDLKQAILKWRG